MLTFNAALPPPEGFNQPAWWFVFQGQRLLVGEGEEKGDSQVAVPHEANLDHWPAAVRRIHFVGMLAGEPCYVAELPEKESVPAGYKSYGLRRLFGRLHDDFLRAAGRSVHILDWDRNHQYCGRCGTPTELAGDRARVCPRCELRAYPRISPAVIMAVVKDKEILLGHARRHPEGFYSVLAGFAEPGETLEEAVAREVREETGIAVKNIRYFGSQPWPFPDSLMIAFTCEYAGGEIDLADGELADAGWYLPGRFPGMTPPAEISIAGQLIEWFLKGN